MKVPTSNIPEVQRRIDRAVELMQLQTEDEIFWMRFQAACKAQNLERLNNRDYKAKNEGLKIND